MPIDYVRFFISFMSLSAVLLGICATIRNAAFSSVINPETNNVNLGSESYEDILEKSGKQAMWAGSAFLATTFLSLGGLVVGVLEPTYREETAIVAVLVFLVGVVLLAKSLLGDYLELPYFNTPSADKPDTEPTDSTEERPEVEQKE